MATMPPSGQISSANLVSVFGGSAPYSSADYYRGGGLVPSTTVSKVYGSWSAYQFHSGDLSPVPAPEYYFVYRSGNNRTEVVWNDVTVASVAGFQTLIDVPSGSSGYEYEQGPIQGTDSGNQFYSVRRRSYTSTTENINTSVPTSGQMSSDDFYSAENP